MAVSTRTRFEVFKRDGFSCRYCGRNRDTDGVKLHADHVLPVSKGGLDNIDNLVTACQDCNLGKAAKLLDELAPVLDATERVEAMRARRAKLEELAHEKAIEEADFVTAWNHWFKLWGSETLSKYHTPYESAIRRYVLALGVDEVTEAMDIAGEKFDRVNNDAVRYFMGVLKHKLADAEGRVVKCLYCTKRIVLDEGDDPAAGWYHPKCKEKHDEALKERCEACKATLKDSEEFICDKCMDAYEATKDKYPLTLGDMAADVDEIDLEITAWDDIATKAGF